MSLSAEGDAIDLRLHPTTEKDVVYNVPEKEIAYGPACYLVCFAIHSFKTSADGVLSGTTFGDRERPEYLPLSVTHILQKASRIFPTP